ncbi:sigma 54-interacting transcriptional regulator [uncultured Mailhella sp.]|uniref:sigma-54-dependent Fis family transcriptional regulator n=1 Tax=uncultured Mailhella sp. TaxID=1981031 RepID=UPI0026072618|nr:sigma 54-interacting transcriptional regulator [uncultured Mailhella sp.]
MEKLFSSISAAHSVIGLSDSTGLILHTVGHEEDIKALPVFQRGFFATEEHSGTNGIGTGLIEKRPIEIIGAEHYYGDALGWYCCSAPIFNENDLVGIFNISTRAQNHHYHTIGLVEAAAYSVSEQLRLRLLLKEQNAMLEFLDEGVLILDSGNKVRALNEKARSMLSPGGSSAQNRLTGLPVHELLPLEKSDLTDVLSAQHRINDREVTLRLPNGVFQYAISCSPIENGGAIITLRSVKRMREYAARMMSQGAVYSFENIVGESTAIREVLRLARKASQSNITTLILGESGTGKELFAQAIHNASSRKNGPFVVVNCGSIPRTLLESELFGYEDGAFTGARKQGKPGKFELADGGTVFLDEIGELPLDAQASLLRLLQENEVVRVGGTTAKHIDIRVVAATNRNLEEAVGQQTFRNDLYYRLNVLSITIPPLRDRKTDIRLLSNFFLEKFSHALGRTDARFTEEVLEALTLYDWPGNVRELENVIERTINIASSALIQLSDLPAHILKYRTQEPALPGHTVRSSVLKTQEMETIMEMLRETQGNFRLAASKLGIARCVLYRKVKQMGMTPGMWRSKKAIM